MGDTIRWQGLILAWLGLAYDAGIALAAEPAKPRAAAEQQLAELVLLPKASALQLRVEGFQMPPGGHLQGVQLAFDKQANEYVMYLSHDSATVAYLVIARFAADLGQPGRVVHVQRLPSDGQSPPLRHAGGIQLSRNVLAVGVEDNQQKLRSEVQFWDVSRPEQPRQLRHLTIQRRGSVAKEMTAGAVGLVQRASDYVLVVGNWDCRAIDTYVSNGRPLDQPDCRFAFAGRWEAARAASQDWPAGGEFGAYQAINLVAGNQVGGPGDALAMVGFDTMPSGANRIDVYSFEPQVEPSRRLVKVASQVAHLAPGNLFRYAAGLSLEQGRVLVLASPSQLSKATTLSLLRASPSATANEPR